jgi:hypothetical protein
MITTTTLAKCAVSMSMRRLVFPPERTGSRSGFAVGVISTVVITMAGVILSAVMRTDAKTALGVPEPSPAVAVVVISAGVATRGLPSTIMNARIVATLLATKLINFTEEQR